MLLKMIAVLPFLALCAVLANGLFQNDDSLRFNSKGEMIFPAHYREWVWLTSGLGMSYNAGAEDPNPDFDNVFVSPQAYSSFLANGVWPNGSVFVLEVRASHHQGSINKTGHYQGDLEDIETHVKKADGTWAFYGFGDGTKPASMKPKSADCYSCHEQHGAVDTTFVQFYPTLLKVAQEKKTLKVENSK
jgi:hypothetical protein